MNEVARLANRDPRDLPVLADCVDPDALDALVSSGPASLSVQFRYADWRVLVDGGGGVVVVDSDARREPVRPSESEETSSE